VRAELPSEERISFVEVASDEPRNTHRFAQVLDGFEKQRDPPAQTSEVEKSEVPAPLPAQAQLFGEAKADGGDEPRYRLAQRSNLLAKGGGLVRKKGEGEGKSRAPFY
jgi:hypothetical protein